MAFMMQADDSAAFAKLMQQHYADLYGANDSPEQVLQRMYDVAGTPPDMRQG